MSGDQRHALIFNAITEGLSEAERFVPLSDREAIARRVGQVIAAGVPLAWTHDMPDERLIIVRLSCGHAKLAIRNVPDPVGLSTHCHAGCAAAKVVRVVASVGPVSSGPEADPLTVRCSACLAPRGEDCIATSSDLPREHPHRLRGLAAAATLRRCPACDGTAWAPAAGGPSAPDAITCPVCEAAPGAACTEGGQDRGEVHVVRVRAAGLGVERCGGCGAVGWVPDVVAPRLLQGSPTAGSKDLREQLTDALYRWALDAAGVSRVSAPVHPRTLENLRAAELARADAVLPVVEAALAEQRVIAEQTQELLDIAHQTSDTSERERARAVQRAEKAEGLLRELLDPDDCYYDHHGKCQAHYLDKRPCPVARAKEMLAALDQPKESTS